MIVCLIKSVFGPELFRIYKQNGEPGRNYRPNNLEFYSNSAISFFRGLYIFCKWTSPVILAFAYYRGYFTAEGILSLSRLAYFIGVCIVGAYIIRGFGRCSNLDYKDFITRFFELNKNVDAMSERRKFLTQYDFEMSYWNPDYKVTSIPPGFKNEPHKLFHNNIFTTIKFSIWRVLSKLCVDTFGLRMAYPGVILGKLINKPHLIEYRKNFIEQKKAQRAVIQTSDKYKNKIDTLFVDQRNTIRYNALKNNFATLDSTLNNNNNESNGNKLVICCDGNASFYEVGIFQIPIENGYSTLGWNYPGFAQSTGLPYPEQLTSAGDAVMQYAISLGFKVENIILFSWSIGGFAVSWLSNQYPEVKAIVMDACFDNITPLAQQQMPKFATEFVSYAIKHNLNLNISNLINKYNGPIQFIRRTQDEIISTTPKVASANRGNDLLLNTLRNRYPHIINEDTMPYIRTWLSAKSDIDRVRILSSYTSDIETCESLLATYLKKNSLKYPILIGKDQSEDDVKLTKDNKLTLALYLADKYLINFESTHCTPLPKDFFRLPWSEQDLLQKYRY